MHFYHIHSGTQLILNVTFDQLGDTYPYTDYCDIGVHTHQHECALSAHVLMTRQLHGVNSNTLWESQGT